MEASRTKRNKSKTIRKSEANKNKTKKNANNTQQANTRRRETKESACAPHPPSLSHPSPLPTLSQPEAQESIIRVGAFSEESIPGREARLSEASVSRSSWETRDPGDKGIGHPPPLPSLPHSSCTLPQLLRSHPSPAMPSLHSLTSLSHPLSYFTLSHSLHSLHSLTHSLPISLSPSPPRPYQSPHSPPPPRLIV